MIKFAPHSKARLASPIVLANRVRYVEDQIHPDHGIKKVVQPSANFGCRGQSPKDFLTPTKEAHAIGKERNDNRKGGGNPTTDLFLEIIVNNPEGVITTPEERHAIDQIMVEKFRGCYIRRGWHLAAQGLVNPPEDWKQLDDAHYLISARDRYGNATMNRFGAGKQTFVSWRNQIDQQICDMFSSNREAKVEPAYVVHRRNLGELLGTKLTKLCQLIAHSTARVVTRANLVAVIEQLTKPSVENPKKEVQLAKVTNELTLPDDKVVWVHFSGRQKATNYRIAKLLLNIAEIQLDLEKAGKDGEFSGGGSSGSGGSGSGDSGSSMAPTETATVETTPFPMPTHPVPVAKKAAKKAARKREKSKTKVIPPEKEQQME